MSRCNPVVATVPRTSTVVGMLLIGSGSLVKYAITYATDLGIKIDLVCTENDASLEKFCGRLDVPFMKLFDINKQHQQVLNSSTDGLAFSINNSSILSDEILSTDVQFFNIHNGLVQKYRGIAEVCVMAAICKSEVIYGSTLHRLFPGQEVDAGPIISQRAVNLISDESFESVFTKSIENYKQLLHSTFSDLSELCYSKGSYEHGENIYSYKHVKQLLNEAPPDRRILAAHLGKYTGLLPRLANSLKSVDGN
jgi:folate-dependent phosphoribosylglycinamide formyltransferase PurN